MLNIDCLNFNDLVIQTEEVFSNRRRADITILDDANKLYILIENKVLSSEGKDQTAAYFIEASKRYQEHEKLFIYLTPNGDDPESKDFVTLSYRELIDIINTVKKNRGDYLEDGVKLLLNQTKKDIEENILTESEIDEICLRLYKTHSNAIERIYQAKPTNKQYYEQIAKGVIAQLGAEWTFKSANSYLAIYKYRWTEIADPKKEMSPIHYELSYLPNKLSTFIHVEDFRGKDNYDKIKQGLSSTKIVEYKNIDLTEKRSIYKKMIINKINPDQIEKDVEKAVKETVKLIVDTAPFIDESLNIFQLKNG